MSEKSLKTGHKQLLLDFPVRPARGRGDFLVTDSNKTAVALLDLWPAWDNRVVALVGDGASGKSHLMAVWQQYSGAACLDAATIYPDKPDGDGDFLFPDRMTAQSRHWGIDNASILALKDPKGLFHLYNLIQEHRGTLLLVDRQPPAGWSCGLPDLISRLRTAAVTMIAPPDDDLIRGLILKHFADRQLSPDQSVIDYLVLRIERSFAAVEECVRAIDRRAAAQKRPITVPLVRQVLTESEGPTAIDEETACT